MMDEEMKETRPQQAALRRLHFLMQWQRIRTRRIPFMARLSGRRLSSNQLKDSASDGWQRESGLAVGKRTFYLTLLSLIYLPASW